jgi:hypothetical protein
MPDPALDSLPVVVSPIIEFLNTAVPIGIMNVPLVSLAMGLLTLCGAIWLGVRDIIQVRSFKLRWFDLSRQN